MTKKHFYAFLLGIGSVLSIFHPVKAVANTGNHMATDQENLRNDMNNIGNDFRRAMQQVSDYERT